jgi:hypothetical protein
LVEPKLIEELPSMNENKTLVFIVCGRALVGQDITTRFGRVLAGCCRQKTKREVGNEMSRSMGNNFMSTK